MICLILFFAFLSARASPCALPSFYLSKGRAFYRISLFKRGAFWICFIAKRLAKRRSLCVTHVIRIFLGTGFRHAAGSILYGISYDKKQRDCCEPRAVLMINNLFIYHTSTHVTCWHTMRSRDSGRGEPVLYKATPCVPKKPLPLQARRGGKPGTPLHHNLKSESPQK
jgi:hypothetical protein